MSILYLGPAQVEIQGAKVLHITSLNPDPKKVEFEVIGLSQPKIRLIDRRPKVVQTTLEVWETNEVEKIMQQFNAPAKVKITQQEPNGEITVELEKTRSKKPRHMMWVTVGIKEHLIPYYHHVNVQQIEPLEKQEFALFCLYRPTRSRKTA